MVQVQGNWVLKQILPSSVIDHLFNPAMLVRIVPDVHFIIRKGPNHILCVLRPPIAVLDLDDLFIDIVREPGPTPLSYSFNLKMTRNRQQNQLLFEGVGQMDLLAEGDQTCVSLTMSGRCFGRFEKVGQLFLETQLRSGMRRFFANFADLLEGKEPQTATYVPPRETSRETLAVAGGAAVMLLGALTFRWWSKSR